MGLAQDTALRMTLVGDFAWEDWILRKKNGVDLIEFAPGPANRLQLGLPEDVPLALFAGDIRTPRKNLETVLHALTETPNVHCAVIGSTQNSPYPILAKNLGLENRVHFLGYRRDVPDLMRGADFFVFPSRYEACSLVLLEAIASGLPIITARTAGGSEIITPDCGIVLNAPDDTSVLAGFMRMMALQPDKRKQMGLAARETALCYSWQKMTDAYLNLYEDVLQKKITDKTKLN